MNGGLIEILPASPIEAMPDTFLTNIYLWGIDVIKAIQGIESPGLTAVIKFITALGTEVFFLPVVLFIFWCVDEKRGMRFGVVLIFSAWINLLLKDLLGQPRPFDIDPSVGLAFEPTYGAPSGHAQASLVFWLSLAAWFGKLYEKRRRLIWTLSIFMVLLTAYTRLYLGVHFPTDVFAGWITGAAVLFFLFVLWPRLQKLFCSAGTRFGNIVAVALVLIMNSVYPNDRSLPALFLGFFIGHNLIRQRFPFSPLSDINGKKPGFVIMLLRCLAGSLGLAIIYSGLKMILPGEESFFSDIPLWGASSPFHELGRFVRYGLTGLWVSAGAPRLFQQTGLAPSAGSTGAAS